jgi:hypothetical protein
MKISNEVANEIRKSLAAEPPREAHRSRAALIRDLAPELIKARKDKNLSLNDLRAILQKSGLQISVGTLKNYLSQSRRPAQERRLGAAAASPKAKPQDGSMSQTKTRADKAHGARSEEKSSLPTAPRPEAAAGVERAAEKPAVPPMPKPPKPIGLVRAGEATESERREIPPMPKPPKRGAAAQAEKSGTEGGEVVPAWSFPLRRDRDTI